MNETTEQVPVEQPEQPAAPNVGAQRAMLQGTGFIIRAETGKREEFSFTHYLGDNPHTEVN